jgi:hypothetical protein
MAYTKWLRHDGALLGDAFPLPLDQPFDRPAAIDAGVAPRELRAMVEAGLIRKVLRGVYAASQAPDSVRFRATALGIVVSEWAVVTDRTAGWLHGMPVLRRGAHLEAPPLDLCHTRDSRSIRPEVDGHRRQLLARDITVVHGIRLTTPLRTALDLGRLSWRFDALAALDAALRIGVDHDHLLEESQRFRGYRGMRQLRWLAPLADGRAESPPESALRLYWHMACLPCPEPQIWVDDDWGRPIFRLDLGNREVRYAAEYDGVEHHSSVAQQTNDIERRTWLETARGWTIDVFTRDDVYAPGNHTEERLRSGFARARRACTIWTP